MRANFFSGEQLSHQQAQNLSQLCEAYVMLDINDTFTSAQISIFVTSVHVLQSSVFSNCLRHYKNQK